jgi:hypothetical protein
MAPLRAGLPPQIEVRVHELVKTDSVEARRDLTGLARALAASLHPSAGFSSAPATRSAALFAAGSFFLALGREHASEFLHQLLPAVIRALRDTDSGVRLAASESLYNITRVVREHIAPFAAATIEALLKAASDKDSEVDRALAILHPLLQVTVNECKTVSASELVTPLVGGLRASVSSAVCTSIRWILSLESSPHIGGELLRDHPDILHLLFSHTTSTSPEVADLAHEALSELLERTVSDLSAGRQPFEYPPVLSVLYAQCRSSQVVRWGVAIEWIQSLTGLRGGELMPRHGADMAVAVIRLYPRAQQQADALLLSRVEEALDTLQAAAEAYLASGARFSPHDQESIVAVVVWGFGLDDPAAARTLSPARATPQHYPGGSRGDGALYLRYTVIRWI